MGGLIVVVLPFVIEFAYYGLPYNNGLAVLQVNLNVAPHARLCSLVEHTV